MAARSSTSSSNPIDLPYSEQEHGDQTRERRERSVHPSQRDGTLISQDVSSSSSSSIAALGGQTWSEFLRETRSNEGGEPSSQRQLDTRRSSMVALDRKRRLTGSVDESVRRRAASGGIYRHGHPYGLATDSSIHQTSRPANQPHHWGTPTTEDPFRDVINPPQVSPNPPYLRRVSSATRRDSGVREYGRPPWQPDSEVTKCPICGTQFTFWYRKHHCRKCGRVVCSACSPHRITIPRQYIVQPPNSNAEVDTTPTDASRIEVIDLTGDDNGPRSRTMSDPNPRPSETPNPALGGGEEVRLCNPCVPDPNPNPPAQYRHPSLLFPLDPDASQFSRLSTTPNHPRHAPPGYPNRPATRNPNAWSPIPSQGSLAAVPLDARHGLIGGGLDPYIRGEERRRRGQGMIFPEDESQDASSDGPRFDFSRNLYDSRAQGRISGAPGSSVPSYYPSFNGSSTSHHHRASESSTAISRHRLPPVMDLTAPYPPSNAPAAARPSRPRIREEDICPVCRRELPSRCSNGSETAREAHIQSCIERYSTPSQSSTPRPSNPLSAGAPPAAPPPQQPQHSRQPSRPMAYATHIATEKDCVTEDGTERECSICLVEFEVGDDLAVLECLCKFHKVCIRAWLEKSGNQCPLHKIFNLEAGGVGD